MVHMTSISRDADEFSRALPDSFQAGNESSHSAAVLSVRCFAFSMVAMGVLFLANTYLSFVRGWPGIPTLFGHLGWLGVEAPKLINEQGVQLRKFNDDVYDSFGEAAEEVFDDVSSHSPLAGKIHASFLAARKDLGGWSKISDQAYVAQRNRVLGV